MRTQKTALRSNIPKDVITSFFSVDVTLRENMCTIFYRILAKENIVYNERHMEFSSKIYRYRELCIDAHNPSRISVTVCYFETRTENNLRKWIVRYDRCRRHVADKTCRFLIRNTMFSLQSPDPQAHHHMPTSSGDKLPEQHQIRVLDKGR
jgi:hypothetical protein